MKQKRKGQLYLERLEMIDSILQNKLVERKQWEDIALSITANMGGERVQSSGSKSKMADALNKCVDMEAEIDRQVDKLIAEKQDIVSTIERLDNPTEYRLLHLRYVQYVDLKDIAVKWGKEYTTITTTHGRALRNVERLMEGRQ